MLLTLSFAAGAAHAGQEFRETGGPGGGAFRSECPAWSHVVGFTGRVGAWLISIEPLCAPLLAQEQKIGAGTANGQRSGGSEGGQFYSVSCPIGYALGAWVFDMVVNSDVEPTFVNAIGMECRLVGSPGQTYRAQIGDDLGATLTKDVAVIAQMGWDRPTFTNSCPPGELVTGVRGRSGIYIDALGLICGPPPTPQEAALCNGYRDAALQAVADNQSLGCGQSGDRWTADGAAHMDWCIGLGEQRAAATQAETAARTRTIGKCRAASLGIQQRIPGAEMRAKNVEIQQQNSAVLANPNLAVQPAPAIVMKAPPAGAAASDAMVAKPAERVVKPLPSAIAVQSLPAAETPAPLVLGRRGGVLAAAPAPPIGFTGAWSTRTDKNWSYEISFVQEGSQVSGNYLVQNGDTGRIRGTMTGKVLNFEWDQDGGWSGTGQFVLAADGNSFQGTYKTNPHPAISDPGQLSGTWSGTRK